MVGVKPLRRRSASYMQGLSSQLMPACALTVLTTSQAMLVEAAKATHGGKIPYDTSVAVFMTETLKLCIALATWLWQRPNLEYTGLENFSPLSWSTLAYTVPATLFIVQNNLVFKALSLLDPPTFQLWACFKIIPVGILARLMLGQRRSTVQWAALCVLALGMATTTTDCDILPRAEGSGRWLGIGILTFNGFLSALSSIVNEWLIKFSDPRAPLMFKNMQIYLWGCLVAAGYSFAHSSSATAWHALLGQAVMGSPLSMAIILNNAAVGLCVSAVRAGLRPHSHAAPHVARMRGGGAEARGPTPPCSPQLTLTRRRRSLPFPPR
jgi:hypothetical protein